MTLPITLLALLSLTQTPEPATDPGLRIVWDLHPDAASEPFLDWLRDRGWCWGVEVPANAAEADFDRVRSRGMAAIPQLHAHPHTRAWHWSRRNTPMPDLAATVELARRISGGRPLMQMFMEDDSAGVGFSARLLREKPATHGGAKALWDLYLREAMGELGPYPDLTVWGMAGFARSAHDYMRHGIDCVIVERSNDDIEDLQTAVAFARGASRQYGKQWGIDLSLWCGVFYGCVPDLPASLYTRHLWVSHLAGAQAYRIEGGGMHFGPDGPGLVARAVDAFGTVAKDLDRGAADAPVAVILADDHGWMTPPYWRTQNEAWNYARIPYRQGDRGMDGFFGAAFPGSVYAMDPWPLGSYRVDEPLATPYALSCITPEFAPTPQDVYKAEPPIPFGKYDNRDEARADFLGNKIDPSPYRPMGDSRWGDIFDVLTESAPQEALDQYRVVVLLGQMDTGRLKGRLESFVRRGGVLVWCAGQATPDDAALCGAVLRPELRVGRAWRWGAEAPVAEAFRYCPAGEPVPEAEVVAATHSGDPLALRHAVGEGAVYTVLIPWFEAGHGSLCGAALRLFDEVIGAVQPVRVEGPPVQWLSTRGAGHRTVLVTNNDGAAWSGKVTLRRADPALRRCDDLLSGEPVPFERAGGDAAAFVSVPPYGVLALRWTE